MSKKKEIKPKHSLHENRTNVGSKNHRSTATVRRLKMYNCRPHRDVKGKIIRVEFGSRELPVTRIQPDRRWFGPTRLIGQRQLECFREELESRRSNNYNVILKAKELPMSLANTLPKQKRADLRDTQTVEGLFGSKSKCANVAGNPCQAQKQKADNIQAKTSTEVDQINEFGNSAGSELHKVIESSDVVIQVLDARDPQGTRCYDLEKHLKENCKHKHMILVLNKCDLIPAWATKGWIDVLSKEYPTLAFHANITKPFGTDSLLSVLRQFAKLKRGKQAISVGFVGYPNVGKSSIISTLRTTVTERIHLIDYPGVVYSGIDSQTDILLNGVVRVENLLDAAAHIGRVLKRVKKEHLERAYKIKDWVDENEFLVKLCNLTGNYSKGGKPDLISAAKTVLNDLQKGKIPFFVSPPKQGDASSHTQNA